MDNSPQEKQVRDQIASYINEHFPVIGRLAGIPIDQGMTWGIRMISWTGEEWPGLEGRPGLCFVEVFVPQEPHDYLLILDISTSTCVLAATYRREFKHLQLFRAWAPITDSQAYAPLPDAVPWRLLREFRARHQTGHILPDMPPPPGAELHTLMDRAALETIIRRDIKLIAKQSALVGVDDHPWDVTRISWTGEEWPRLRPLPGYCYVEAFEHANPPHDFIYVVSVLSGTPEFIACYEGDIGTFDLTIYRTEAEALTLPNRVER
ncbi:MAG: hypothetical protein KDK97_09145, partial [Verrucomicrobiales bacterium]|nr:hypothetical protein [Verrucomicrobiales bacterium]MCP5560984.1 hypothetical protein [Verrucomicrobiaceae bacterium]